MTIVCEPSLEQAKSLAGRLAGLASLVRPVTDLGSLDQALRADPAETVVVLGAGVQLEQAVDFSSWLRQQRPAVGVILLRADLEVDSVLAAMRAGVREVLSVDDEVALSEACRRYEQQQLPQPAGGAGRRGHVVTVYSSKGGCGKTTLAVNVAVQLARAGQQVCLVDFDLTFGDVAITLGLTPKRTIADVAGLGDSLDELKVRSLITPYQAGIDCLLAPVAPGEAEKVHVSATTALLAVLSSMYDYVIVDTPSQLTEHVLAALDASHQQLLLTAPEIPALKNLRVTLDMLDLLGYDRAGRTVVLNRADAEVGLSTADVERVVNHPIAGHVPSSREVPISINKGEPLTVRSPEHPVASAIGSLVHTHILHTAPAVATVQARRGAFRLHRRSS